LFLKKPKGDYPNDNDPKSFHSKKTVYIIDYRIFPQNTTWEEIEETKFST
jgi:hypothetical protein